MSKKPWTFKINDLINERYLIIKEIAQGGTSEVYKVRDRYNQQLYALKIMQSNPNLNAFFNKETNILANLSFSGNVVTIKDLGIIHNLEYDYAFIILDLYENGTIDNIPTDFKYNLMSNSELNYYFKRILKALESIHYNEKHIMIHKDIKPQNILINHEREPFISDFGISLIASKENGEVILNDGLGTPKYMAPELALPIIDSADNGPGYFVDLYSIGIMLYKYTTGLWPYEDYMVKEEKINPKKSELQRAQRILNLNVWMDLVIPSEYNPNINPKLETIILKALAKDFTKRYQNVHEMLIDLENINNDNYVLKPFYNYNYRSKSIPKYFDMYPKKFSTFFKRYNFAWFIGIGLLVILLIIALILALFLS